MSLFSYKITLEGGKEKTGQITAKTKEAAQTAVAKLHKVVDWQSIKEIPSPKVTPAQPPASPIAKLPRAKSATKLDQLLFLQSSKCFFCGRVLTKEEASVEHLQPKSQGGSNVDDNVVACCITLNRAFGSMGLKQKFRIVLEKAGSFSCPKN